MKHFNKQLIAIVSLLIFSIGIMLSCNVFAAKPPAYAIGDTGPGGGIVFHITDDGKHGLEAAPSDLRNRDQVTQFPWDDGTGSEKTKAVKVGFFDGSFNTDRIVSTLGEGIYAALLCANYSGGGYGDWYLPSHHELAAMLWNLVVLHGDQSAQARADAMLLYGFSYELYWSSSEVADPTVADTSNAWCVDFQTWLFPYSVKSELLRMRPVRAF